MERTREKELSAVQQVDRQAVAEFLRLPGA